MPGLQGLVMIPDPRKRAKGHDPGSPQKKGCLFYDISPKHSMYGIVKYLNETYTEVFSKYIIYTVIIYHTLISSFVKKSVNLPKI